MKITARLIVHYGLGTKSRIIKFRITKSRKIKSRITKLRNLEHAAFLSPTRTRDLCVRDGEFIVKSSGEYSAEMFHDFRDMVLMSNSIRSQKPHPQ